MVDILLYIWNLISKIFGPAIDLFNKIFKKDNLTIPYPKRTMIFSTKDPGFYRWHLGSLNKKLTMEIDSSFQVTNITKDLNILPGRAILKKTKTFGLPYVWHSDSGMIPYNQIRHVDIRFTVERHFCREGQSFISDIIVFDQFNNKHLIKNILFKYQ